MFTHVHHQRETRPYARLAFLAMVVPLAGCIDVGRYRAESEETRQIPTVGTKKVAVTTDNGSVRVRPANEGDDTIEIRALIRAEGSSEAEVQECLQAIEITTPVSGSNDSTQEIGWAWREPRHSGWRAALSFEITMPHTLELDVQTKNGQIDVVGITADCKLHSENGAVRAVAATNELTAESSNGAITVESPASEIHLQSNNGAIRAALTNESDVSGSIKTHNGGVKVSLAKSAAANLECHTSSGRIRSDLQLSDVDRKGRSRLNGKHAGGGEVLEIQTHNGGITLKPYSSDNKHDVDDE